MYISNSFLITRKESPSLEADEVTNLLIKSGMIHKNSSGVYTYLPLGFKVLENIKNVIRNEMNKLNSFEMLMPTLVNENIFSYTSRNKLFGKELFRINDRHDKEYCLCPTHEELFSVISKLHIESYKDLHFNLYQISSKYRDELKIEYGLTRKKEFIMFDAYSFDTEENMLSVSYDKMYYTFMNIFKKLCLDVVSCESYPGKMLGSLSEEFHVITNDGDNDIVKCTSCNYISNADIAQIPFIKKHSNEERKNIKKITLKNVLTINDVSKELDIPQEKIIKSLIYKINNKYKMILMRGNDKVNDSKLKRLFKTNDIFLVTRDELESIGTHIGYIGPIKTTMEVIADNNVKNIVNGVCGSNEENYYYINVNEKVDYKVDKYVDIKYSDLSDLCPRCKSKIELLKGLEVGNMFKLDTNYSEIFDIKYLDEKNNYNYVHMGSYGIGLDRCMNAIVKLNHDEDGIIWPTSIAPYKVAIVLVNEYDRESKKYAEELYSKLLSLNISSIIDDRNIVVNSKYKYLDLIGIPIRITISSDFTNNKIELKQRYEKEIRYINKEEIITVIKKLLNY